MLIHSSAIIEIGGTMTTDKFIQIVDKKLQQAEDLYSRSYESSEFKRWRATVKDLIINAFGTNSHQFGDFHRIVHIPRTVLPTSPQEDHQAYIKGLDEDKALLLAMRESAEDYGIPSERSPENPSSTKTAGLVQNFYLTQNQVQNVQNEIDIDNLDESVRDQLNQLFSELKKKDSKDTSKIADIVKWLADNAIQVLIAVLTAHH